ncbi:Aste57867_20613 [Aphanomyces stellatus]|uniref:Aste57867_20613 protein n=1 Tax=Aphanomyces stellatus TaxID=120398 RepID=A0A485LFG5_9STRA|nr:hypothetical protein As57867_020545 [Aphanomyces stellatus]VFT97293.1 Aste57867_20613 [Aphanomyces stellatus]
MHLHEFVTAAASFLWAASSVEAKKKKKAQTRAAAPDALTADSCSDRGAALTQCMQGDKQLFCAAAVNDASCSALPVMQIGDRATKRKQLVAFMSMESKYESSVTIYTTGKEPEKYRGFSFGAQASSGQITVIAVKKASDVLTIAALPARVTRLDCVATDHVVLENMTLSSSLGAISFTDGRLKGYPTPGFRNLTLPPSLVDMTLQSMQMTTFDPTEWRDSALITLNVFDNALRSLDNVIFPQAVELLNLGKTQLVSMANTTLPRACKILKLHNNQLSSIEAVPVAALAALRELDLSGNPISRVSGALPPSLHTLMMDNCRLTDIPANWTAVAPHLKHLSLTGNQLTAFSPTDLPPSLTSLELDDNPLVEFNVDARLVAQLRKLKVFTASTSHVTCAHDATKTLVQHHAFVCVRPEEVGVRGANASGGRSSMAAVGGIVGAVAAVTITLALVLLLKYRRQNRLMNRPTLHRDADSQLDAAVASYVLNVTRSTPDKAVSVVSSGVVAAPTFLVRDASLAAWLIPADAIDDFLPVPGNVCCGVYHQSRVMLLSLPSVDEATVRLLTRAVYPKLLAFRGLSCDWSGGLMAVSEWMDGGCVHALLETPNLLLGLAQKVRIALDVADALVFLHTDMRVAHGHLSYDTVWLDGDGHAKLSLVSQVPVLRPVWLAPEVRQQTQSSPSADIYALGVLLSTMYRQQVPDLDDALGESMSAVSSSHVSAAEAFPVDWFALSCPAKLRELIAACLLLAPHRRPTAMDVQLALRTLMTEVDAMMEMASDADGRSTLTQLNVSVLAPSTATMSLLDVSSAKDARDESQSRRSSMGSSLEVQIPSSDVATDVGSTSAQVDA